MFPLRARPQTARARISNPVSGGQSSPQEVLLAQFSLYVHKGALKPDSFLVSPPIDRDIFGGTSKAIEYSGQWIRSFMCNFKSRRCIQPCRHSGAAWGISYTMTSKGSCQVENNTKIRQKLGLLKPHTPTRLSDFSFLFKQLETWIQHKKHKISKKKKKIRVGAWPTHPLSSFSRIFLFFSTWQNP